MIGKMITFSEISLSRMVNNDVDYGNLRWTVDTSEDLEFIRQVYAHFSGRDDFTSSSRMLASFTPFKAGVATL